MRVRAVLFDADGVIQKRPPEWERLLRQFVANGRDSERFIEDVFSAEIPSLSGHSDFSKELADVLDLWKCGIALPEFLKFWTMIEVDTDITRTIRGMKEAGFACHLASNQEAHKARYMSEVLEYRDLFDREFYSCDLGVAKPDAAYFSAIVESTALEPSSLLFIDDRQENVEAAREVGMRAAVFNLASGVFELHQLLKRFEIDVA